MHVWCFFPVNYKLKCVNLEPPLTEPNVQKHNQRFERTEKVNATRDRTKSRRKLHYWYTIYKLHNKEIVLVKSFFFQGTRNLWN